MATVEITVNYTIDVPELDETETPEEEQEILENIKDDWSYHIERDGYEAYCESVNY